MKKSIMILALVVGLLAPGLVLGLTPAFAQPPQLIGFVQVRGCKCLDNNDVIEKLDFMEVCTEELASNYKASYIQPLTSVIVELDSFMSNCGLISCLSPDQIVWVCIGRHAQLLPPF